jgi:glucose/arabinose dehydrogenase
MYGRDSTNWIFPNLVNVEDDNNIVDEMHRITKDTNFGWPNTYYNGAQAAADGS